MAGNCSAVTRSASGTGVRSLHARRKTIAKAFAETLPELLCRRGPPQRVRLGGYLIVFYISATGKASRTNIEILEILRTAHWASARASGEPPTLWGRCDMHTYVMRSSALLCSTRRHRLANKHAVVVANSF